MLREAFNELLMEAARSLVNIGCNIWNSCADVALYILGRTPSGLKPEAWQFVTGSIYPIFLAIGTALMSLFFIIGFLRSSIDIRHTLTLENTLMLFVRLVIANAFMVSILTWLPMMFNWAANLVGAIAGTSGSRVAALGTLSADTILGEATVTGLGGIPSLIISLFFLVLVTVSGFLIVLTVFKRIFNLYLIIPLAPLAFSTIAGGQGITNTAYAYIKTFLTICFECVLIAIVLAIGGYFIGAGGMFNGQYADGPTAALVEACISVTMVSAAVRGADTFIRRAMGF